MPTDILRAIGASTAFTITLASLGNGSSRQTTRIADASPSINLYRVYYKITTGTSPTSGGTIEFYLARADDHATEHTDGGVGASDAAYSGNVDQLELAHVQPVTNTSNQAYEGSFLIEDPGSDFCVVLKNNTGVALHATESNHRIRYQARNEQIQ